MNIFTKYILVILLSGLIFSCKPTKICPAYHSYFILDPAVTKTTFSLFGADSLPRDPKNDLWQIDKKKVGIADDIAYKQKLRKQSIISMESIYLQKEDPFENQLAMAEMDSSMLDSMQHVRAKGYDDFYNYDQMIYLHYFGKYLPRPKPEPDISEDLEPEEETMITDDQVVEEEEEPKEKKGFFKKLFGKKKKNKKERPDENSQDEEISNDEESEEDIDN